MQPASVAQKTFFYSTEAPAATRKLHEIGLRPENINPEIPDAPGGTIIVIILYFFFSPPPPPLTTTSASFFFLLCQGFDYRPWGRAEED